MAEIDYEADEQDQSEAFDETHLDDEGDGDVHLETADDVLDVTQADGDGGDEDLELDEELGLDGVEPEADSLMGVDSPRLTAIDLESNGQRGDDEVELVYSGLMRDRRGAQASAAHWESRRLSDDDIEDLGYGPSSDKETEQ